MAGQDKLSQSSLAIDSMLTFKALLTIAERVLTILPGNVETIVRFLKDSMNSAENILQNGIPPNKGTFVDELFTLFADGVFMLTDHLAFESIAKPIIDFYETYPQEASKLIMDDILYVIRRLYPSMIDEILVRLLDKALNTIEDDQASYDEKLRYYNGMVELRNAIEDLKDEIVNFIDGNTPYISINTQGIKDALIKLGLKDIDAEIVAKAINMLVDVSVKTGTLDCPSGCLYEWTKERIEELDQYINDASNYVGQNDSIELSNSA